MKNRLISKLLIVAIAAFLSFNKAQANDIAAFDGLSMFASKSTLMMEIGNYKGQFALKVHFGYGLAAKNIGIVYKEKMGEKDGAKIREALAKLPKIINDPKNTFLRVDKELSVDIGLTFDTYVNTNEIQ